MTADARERASHLNAETEWYYEEAYEDVTPRVIVEPQRRGRGETYTLYERGLLDTLATHYMQCRAVLRVFERWRHFQKTPDYVHRLLSANFCPLDIP